MTPSEILNISQVLIGSDGRVPGYQPGGQEFESPTNLIIAVSQIYSYYIEYISEVLVI